MSNWVLPPKKTAGFSPSLCSRLGDKKTRAPNHHFQLGISEFELEDANTIKSASPVNRLPPALSASNVKGMTRLARNRNHARVFSNIFEIIKNAKIPFVYAANQAPVPLIHLRPIPNNAPTHAKKSSALPCEKSSRPRPQNPKCFPGTE
jgi:hypothetical protein